MLKSKKRGLFIFISLMLVLTFTLSACAAPAIPAQSSAASSEPAVKSSVTESSAAAETKKFKIGFANSSLNHPWRIAIQKSIEDTCATFPNIELYTNEAGEDPVRQNNNVEDLIAKGIDLLLVCTVEGEPFKPSVELCKEKGIPLVPVDRGIIGDDFTCYIQEDNVQIGVTAADWIAEQLTKKYGSAKGNVVELQGVPGNLPAEERKKGFHDQIDAKYPNIKIVAAQPTDYTRANSITVMENILQAQPSIDAVYTHEDQIALGAIDALKEAKRLEGVIVTGNGGSKEALDSIKAGEMTSCFTYSPVDFGIVGVDAAVKILNGEKVDKVLQFKGDTITKDNVDKYLEQMAKSGQPYVSTRNN